MVVAKLVEAESAKLDWLSLSEAEWTAIRLSLLVSTVAVAASLPFGVLVALALSRGNPLFAVGSLRQAERLVQGALPSLVGEEAEAFGDAAQDIAAQLRDLAG